MRGLVIAIVVLLGCQATLEARDIYVANLGGDDRNEGTQERPQPDAGPVQTIERALCLALPGDRIVLTNTGVPYHESIGLSAWHHSGSPVMPLVIDGRGATLDGSQPVPQGAWRSHFGAVLAFDPPRKSAQQLFQNGRPLVRRPIVSAEGRLPQLAPLEWCLHRGTIYFCAEDGVLPDDAGLSYASLPVGITLYHVHDVIITNLTVQGFQLDGVNAHDGVLRCRLAEVTMRGNGRSGLTVAGSSKLELNACVIGDNGAAQVRTEALGLASIVGSHLIDTTAPAVVKRGGIVFLDGVRQP